MFGSELKIYLFRFKKLGQEFQYLIKNVEELDTFFAIEDNDIIIALHFHYPNSNRENLLITKLRTIFVIKELGYYLFNI